MKDPKFAIKINCEGNWLFWSKVEGQPSDDVALAKVFTWDEAVKAMSDLLCTFEHELQIVVLE